MQNAIYYKCTVYYLSTYMQGIIMYLVHADMPQMHCAYVYVHVLYIYMFAWTVFVYFQMTSKEELKTAHKIVRFMSHEFRFIDRVSHKKYCALPLNTVEERTV